MNKMKYVLSFCIGLASGYFITNHFLKKKYEEMTEKEIESIREWFANKSQHHIEYKHYEKNKSDECVDNDVSSTKDSFDKTQVDIKTNKKDDNKEAYADILVDNGYCSDVDENGPMVISPYEFGEDDEYDTISLSYFDDGVLADELLCPVEDIADVVGEDFASHFGEYENDSVFVRNDRLKSYYEILLEHRTYSEAVDNQ